MFEEMRLGALSFDMLNGEPLILLKDSSQKSSFLVSGGNQEIRYLLSEFSGTIADSSSPFSLIIQMISDLCGKIKRLEILPGENESRVGRIFVETPNGSFSRDCRPVDVVVISSKLSMPVHVSYDVLGKIECEMKVAGKTTEEVIQEYPRGHSGDDKDFLM